MMDILMALLTIGLGVFMIIVGVMVGIDLPLMHGVDLVMGGLTAFLCVISGLMCFAVLTEM